jgi:asparagine synthase (glutamine-hydrolysing)
VSQFAGIVALSGAGPPHLQALPSERTRRTAWGVATGTQNAFSPNPRGEILCAAFAELINRRELGAALGLPRADLDGLGDEDLLSLTYERDGDAGLARVLGRFALAYWNDGKRTLTLARDCMGEAALFFSVREGRVYFATTLNGLFALPGMTRELDEVAFGRFLALDLSERRKTVYRGVERVPSRTRIELGPGGRRDEVRYWSPAPRPLYRRHGEYVAHARALLDTVVGDVLHGTPKPALLLSGGLDSSAIAATAMRLRLDLACYTGVPRGAVADRRHRFADESGKIAALQRLYPRLDSRLIRPPPVHALDADPVMRFQALALPARNVANLGWFSGIEDAIDGDTTALLTGTWGNIGLSWGGRPPLAGVRALAQSLRQPAVLGGSALNPQFARDHAIAPPRFDQLRDRHSRMGAMFDHNQFARDAAALLGGTRPRHAPLGDRRLLEFCLCVPERFFGGWRQPRAFARAVLADRLPPEILDERRRGLQAADWFAGLDARRTEIAEEIERIAASPLARRLLDIPRLTRLVEDWPTDDAAAEARRKDYRLALRRGIHAGRFIRWIEGANA